MTIGRDTYLDNLLSPHRTEIRRPTLMEGGGGDYTWMTLTLNPKHKQVSDQFGPVMCVARVEQRLRRGLKVNGIIFRNMVFSATGLCIVAVVGHVGSCSRAPLFGQLWWENLLHVCFK